MARHNLLLGTASGSVGDVTMYRREGVQVNRARVREIANPKTNSQAQQRNFLAPVAKFYAPLASVLEKSYEGLNKSKSYSAFLKKNIDLARANGWYLPKGTPFFPLPYQVSRGTIQPITYELDPNSNPTGMTVLIGGLDEETPSTLTVGTFTQQMIDLGYRQGDQVTIILIADNGNGEYFAISTRFYLAEESTEFLKDILGPIQLQNVGPDGIALRPGAQFDTVAGCAIISRYDNGQWRRSTQNLIVNEDIMTIVESGEQAETAIRSYQDNNYTPTSEVYLNGSDETVEWIDSHTKLRTVTGLTTFGFPAAQGSTYPKILCALTSTGAKMQIVNDIEGDADYGKVLESTGGWGSTTRILEPFLPLRSKSGAIPAWLMSQGVDQSVFQ